MNAHEHSHVELAQLAVVVRDLTEVVQIQARELKRLAELAGQQTHLRDQPKEIVVAASTLTALHQEAKRIVDRLEE
jgi:hypothetical protein